MNLHFYANTDNEGKVSIVLCLHSKEAIMEKMIFSKWLDCLLWWLQNGNLVPYAFLFCHWTSSYSQPQWQKPHLLSLFQHKTSQKRMRPLACTSNILSICSGVKENNIHIKINEKVSYLFENYRLHSELNVENILLIPELH